MNIRLKIFKFIAALIFLALITWIGLEVFYGRYLKAVAISGVGSLLMWFAMGLGTPPSDDA